MQILDADLAFKGRKDLGLPRRRSHLGPDDEVAMTEPTELAGRPPDDAVSAEGARLPRGRLLFLLPVVIFLCLVLVFFLRISSGDPSNVPSALVGRPVPEFGLASLPGLIAQ